MRPPALNESMTLLIKGEKHSAVCKDCFDGGFGWYIDATLPKKTRFRFSAGDQCEVSRNGEKCLADFVSYPTGELWNVRFLIPK